MPRVSQEERNEYHREYYANNRDKIRNIRNESQKRSRDKDLEASREKERLYYKRSIKENPERAAVKRRQKRARAYGLTPDEYDRLTQGSGAKCEICRKFDVKLAIDHCHESGKIRGVLCFGCNSALGKLGDNSQGLEVAMKYLKRFEEKQRNVKEVDYLEIFEEELRISELNNKTDL